MASHLVRLKADLQSVLVAALCVHTACSICADENAAPRPAFSDVVYAETSDGRLTLDIYPSSHPTTDPLIVWVHGGAWRAGSKERVPIVGLVNHGFSIASVDYRLTPVAPFPANVHDIKAAVRFLRAHAQQFGLQADRIFIAGASAGGHLAALTGVTSGVAELEGCVGEDGDVSSRVDGIVSFYGAANLQTILAQSTPHGLSVRKPALKLLLGDLPENVPEKARLASPVTHVDPSDPPLLLIHGDQDPQMPINQSHELHAAYKNVKRPVTFHVVHGAAHGGPAFYTPEMLKLVADFLHAVP